VVVHGHSVSATIRDDQLSGPVTVLMPKSARMVPASQSTTPSTVFAFARIKTDDGTGKTLALNALLPTRPDDDGVSVFTFDHLDPAQVNRLADGSYDMYFVWEQ